MNERPLCFPQINEDAPILITGGAGFIGSNLADRLATSGRDVIIYDVLARSGVEANLEWLLARHKRQIRPIIADIRDVDRLNAAVNEAGAVFHLAAQVAVTTSLVSPREDFEINLGGTFNVLDALRRRADAVPLVFASTNKVYGNLPDVPLGIVDDAYVPLDAKLRARGIDESRPIEFHTPYGCSKGGADQYVLDFARSYQIPAVVMRMSCIYGPRQMGTEDQGWVAHFLMAALSDRPISIYGDGCQVRDIMHVADTVAAYVAVLERIDAVSGSAFNIGGGPANAVSLRQLLAHVERVIARPVTVRYSDWRAGDQRYYVSDMSLATKALGLTAPVSWRDGVADLADWFGSAAARSGGLIERLAIEASS